MLPRERIMQNEALILSEFACKAADTRGRELPEAPDDIRTDFQRDRDRIIHCRAFRRLKHKTQVFLIPHSDHYRTRLTHTLEVSQISRTVARALGLNEDLTEAIALGHDLGHTPFGHDGERALNEIMPGGFSHNMQGKRVVQVIEKDGRGLNLTAEVIDGNRACFRDLELGLISQEEFAEAVRRTFPAVAAIPDEQLLEAWNAMLMPFDAQRVELLRELGKRCPVYLLSNTNLPHRIRFRESFRERFGGSFDELFVRCFYSDELHLRKPDPEIYRSVARQIGTPPGKLLFIDDNAANVSAARGEGWQACHLTGGITVTDLFEL